MRHCLSCHTLGEAVVDSKCLACHTEIAALRDAKRGYHGVNDLGQCAKCHPEHGGIDFELVHWEEKPERFDHALAGWRLDGKHVPLACDACHRAELRKDPLVISKRPELAADSWLGLGTECASCHADPHEARFGAECATCHTTSDFHAITESNFDHERTRYPLRGAHKTVACAECHDPHAPEGKKPAFTSCASCHADPHEGKATLAGKQVDCEACHRVEGFAPSTFTLAQHARTDFALLGGHQRVSCDRCHGGKGRSAREPAMRAAAVSFHPRHGRCADCHASAHGAQLAGRSDGGTCESCHTVERFAPSTFTVARHEETGFPLRGAHEDAACGSCHGMSFAPSSRGSSPTDLGSAGIPFRLAHARCVECHRDPHAGRFERADSPVKSAGAAAKSSGQSAKRAPLPAEDTCRSCHDDHSFRPSSVDAGMHDRFAFPLEGAHRAVPCFECHRELREKQAASTLLHGAAGRSLRFDVKDSSCRGCHDDPHGAQFDAGPTRGECSVCHATEGFAPATRFDHEKHASFSLEGPHEDVACGKCHRPAPQGESASTVRYRPIPHRCEDCHATPSTGGSS
jgi:hypothetical protein